jgi:hypothetical protein
VNDELVAQVLRDAHQQAEAIDAPGEARAILELSQSFADQLAAADPEFDRIGFIANVTDDGS